MRMVKALMLVLTLTVAASYMGGCTREKVIEENDRGHGDWHHHDDHY